MGASLTELWQSSPPRKVLHTFEDRPSYLAHAMAPGLVPATSVRLRMHGEIRLQKWRSFEAEEVLHRDRGFVWKARVCSIRGTDSLVDGVGKASWNLLGVIPVLRASGRDVSRSATGRWLAESLFLPTMLLPENGAVWWGSRVTLEKFGEAVTLKLTLGEGGRLKAFQGMRWGNPLGAPFGYYPFGGIVEEERPFGGYTIPSTLRVGWRFGTPGWEEGEFFRMTVDDADYR